MRELAGRTALVTGATGGLGGPITRALAAQGMRVVISGRRADALHRLSREHPAGALLPVPADLSLPGGPAALLRRAEAAAGGTISVLVNDAGAELASAFERYSDEEIEGLLRVDLVAVLELTRAAVVGMLAGGGHVVNVVSLGGKGAVPYDVPYAAAKWGLAGATRSLRAEYEGRNVGFSAVFPGFVTRAGMHARARERGVGAPRAFGETTPEHVADAVVRAIRQDLPEVIVTAHPVRPAIAIGELSPRLGAWLTRRSGVQRYCRAVAQQGGRA